MSDAEVPKSAGEAEPAPEVEVHAEPAASAAASSADSTTAGAADEHDDDDDASAKDRAKLAGSNTSSSQMALASSAYSASGDDDSAPAMASSSSTGGGGGGGDDDEEDDGGADSAARPPKTGAGYASAAASSSDSASASRDDGESAGSGRGDEDPLREAVYTMKSTAGRGYVVAYGWIIKQGEGGFLKRKNWKRRFFVMYKVPHGSILVYYNNDKPEAENIMGYVDLRLVTEIRRAKAKVDGADRVVLEVVTTPRTYFLSPVTVNKSIFSTADGNCINILGWPVAELAVGAQIDGDKEGFAQLQKVVRQWELVLKQACMFKQLTMHAEVSTISDSTTVLPDHVYLMVTPTDVVILDGKERDKAFACWPYRDLASWKTDTSKDLQINVRSVSSTIRCTFAVNEDTPRESSGLQYAKSSYDIRKLIDKNIKELVALKKAGKTT